MPVKYDWKKKFGTFELRVRNILTARLTFEGTIYYNSRRNGLSYLVDTVRGATLHRAQRRGLIKLKKILEHGTEQISSYTGGDV